MPSPGADHPITLEPAGRRWRVQFAGHVIADSPDAVILREQGYPPRVYFPRQDVGMEYLSRSDRRTRCPYKGDASYYSVMLDGQWAEHGIWTYETPIAGMEPIAGRLAFDESKGFEVYSVDEAEVNPGGRERPGETVDEVVQHTDAGDGTSQRPHWAPNVDLPERDGGVR